MTPGILNTNPQEAETTLKRIEKISCFPDLVSFLKEKLLMTSLNDLAKDSAYNSLLQKCILEFKE